MTDRTGLSALVASASEGFVLMDGGMGTTLEDRGVPCRTALWSSVALLSAEGRALTREIHREFAAAGARILVANSHNAGLSACREFLETEPDAVPPEARTPEALLDLLSRAALDAARAAARPGILVAAGLGSVEGPYATESSHSVEECEALLLAHARSLEAAGAETLLFETLTTREEIEAVARLAAREDRPAIGAGLTCGPGARTLASVPVRAAAERLAGAGVESVFVQCTRFDLVDAALAKLVDALAGTTAIPGVYANDGRVWIDRIWRGDRIAPADYAAAAVRWIDAGARIVGGCCGTSPAHVAAIASARRPG